MTSTDATGRTHPPHTTRLIVEGETRPDWRNYAACRNTDPEIFFAVGVGAAAEAATAEAKAICAGCDVVRECGAFFNRLQATLPGSPEGVWAGTSDADRNSEVRNRQRAQDRARQQQRRAAA